jgi:hypothetical protein
MKLNLLVATALCLLFVTLSLAYADSVRIMPLGDSITSGYNLTHTQSDYMVGYRQKLYRDLIDGGYDVEFVGSMNSGESTPPAFDFDHEGRGGWCADGCDAGSGDILDNVYTFLTNNPADVVLLHIGTNDISANHEDPDEVGGILDEIYNYSPDITVVLPRIISRTDGKADQTKTFNDGVETIAQSRIALGHKIIWFDEMVTALTYPDDLDSDGIHPNQNGYEKMANVWFNALQAILPPPNRLINVQKDGTGEGTVRGIPEVINCGISCSNSLQYGTTIKLVAAADNGSRFSGWVGCDSLNGDICTVIMDSNVTVRASFDAVTEVKLLSPKGGETVSAGTPEYVITWEGPVEAAKFRLSSSPGCRIKGGFFTGTSAALDIPQLRKNKTNCFMKVTAFDNAGKKIGYDTSDGEFTIEVVSLTSPTQGTNCTGGQSCPITWAKSAYVPAASIELYYSLKNGYKWIKIPDTFTGEAESFDWTAPNVSESNTKSKIKIILRNSDGKIVGSHKSGNFTIRPGI